MNTHYVFDLDGVLTDARQKMDLEFSELFAEWAKTHDFSICTGSDLSKVTEQVPYSILILSKKLFCNSGNSVYEYSKTEDKNYIAKLVYETKFECSKELQDSILREINYCNWPGKKYGNHIEYRGGSLNVSIVGRSCPQEVRQQYYEWDKHDGERLRLVNMINEKFPEYTAVIGGMISCDVTLKDKDKSQILEWFDLSKDFIEFYGDRIYDGNDKPLADRIEKLGCGFSYQVHSYKDLINIINENS